MAHQDPIRVLVPYGMADELRTNIFNLSAAEITAVTISAPDPATYRGDGPERRLGDLLRYGWKRLVLGAVVGAVIGAGLALLIEWQYSAATIPLLAFGGAWGGAATASARAVQVAKEDEPDDLPDETVRVEPEDTSDLRVMTIVVPNGLGPVDEFLNEHEQVQIFDSQRPIVDESPKPRS